MKVLFLSHSATRTGAPTSLLDVAGGLVERHGVTAGFVVGDSGPLLPNFRRLGPTTVRQSARTHALLRRLPVSGLTSFARAVAGSRYEGLDDGYHVVYSNSLVNGPMLELLDTHLPVVVHARESARYCLASGLMHAVERSLHARRFLATSRTVVESLVGLGADPARVDHIPIGLDDPWFDLDDQPTSRAVWRRHHDVAENEFVVGAVGRVEWNKGPDLFVDVATRTVRALPETAVKFFWVGETPDRWYGGHLVRMGETAGVGSVATFLGPTRDPRSFYDGVDLILVTSRAEGFSRAMLEASARCRPVVAFAAADGPTEFLSATGSPLVPGTDAEAMSLTVANLIRDRSLVADYATRAHQHARRHHNNRTATASIFRVLEEVVAA